MRLGDLDALKKKLQARHDNGEEDFDKGYNIGIETAIDLIDNAPTVEYTFEEAFQKTVCENKLYCPARPQGEWKMIGTIGLAYKCNKCGEVIVVPTNFCPNCGAKMEGGAE